MKPTKYQLEETQKEVKNLINSGMQQYSLSEFKKELEKFGLKLDMNPKGYLLKYYNTSNPQHYLCVTTMAIDKTGFSYCNINGYFYNTHLLHTTDIGKQFREFKASSFCVLPSGHILTV